MNRREVIRSLGYLSTHAMFPAILSGFVASCRNPEKKDHPYEFFTPKEITTITEVIDLVLPATATKSASQVNTHLFLDQVFARCMTPEQQEIMRTGIGRLNSELLSAPDKLQHLNDLDKKAYDNNENAAYFKVIKQYAMIGFFTSEEGETKASNYVKIPEAYRGEVPVANDTLNYGKTSLNFYL